MNIKEEAVSFFKEKLANTAFNAKNISMVFGELLPTPLLVDGNKGREYWQGVCSVFDHSGLLALYGYDSSTKKSMLILSDFKVVDFVSDVVKNNEAHDLVKTQDDLLKESRDQALSAKAFKDEVSRIQDFINQKKVVQILPVEAGPKVEAVEPVAVEVEAVETGPKKNKRKAVTLNDLDRMDSEERTNNLGVLYENSQILEDTLCSYGHLFSGLKDHDLHGVRIIDRNIEVLDAYENPLFLKRGDIIIKYADSVNGNETYTIKSLYKNKCYEEVYSASGGGLSNFKLFGDVIVEADKWVFIAFDFLSANAIHATTGVKTLAVPSEADIGAIYNEIRTLNPDVNIAVYRSGGFDKRLANHDYVIIEGQQRIYNVYIDKNVQNWCAYRELLLAEIGEKAIVEFKNILRLGLSDAVGYFNNNSGKK